MNDLTCYDKPQEKKFCSKESTLLQIDIEFVFL
jgi:hypothetical protein